MKKSQLLTALGLLTLTGIAMVAAGLTSLSQLPDTTLSQAWTGLWEQHALFAWVTAIYCSITAAVDLWVIFGILYQAPERNRAR
jgi:hypothetical protein